MSNATNAIALRRHREFVVSALNRSVIGSATPHQYGELGLILSLATREDDVVVALPPGADDYQPCGAGKPSELSGTEQGVEPQGGSPLRPPPRDRGGDGSGAKPILLVRPGAREEEAVGAEDARGLRHALAAVRLAREVVDRRNGGDSGGRGLAGRT